MKSKAAANHGEDSPIGLKATEVAVTIFDELVHRTLIGDAPLVRESGFYSSNFDTPLSPRLNIMGGPSLRAFALDSIPIEVTDRDVISEVPGIFDNLMQEKWRITMEFYDELRLLGLEIDDLAKSEVAGYLEEARKLRAGKEQARGNYKKTIKISCGLAEAALRQWVEAVGLSDEVIERQRLVLGDQPNVEVWGDVTQIASDDSYPAEQANVLKKAI